MDKKLKKIFLTFSFHSIKMQQEAVQFRENSIIKSAFHKKKRSINIKYEKILIKYLKILNKVKSLIKKELNSEPLYNDKNIKTKIKIWNDKVYTNFQHNKIPKGNEHCACLSVILLDSIFVNSNNEYYPQIFLEECKYAIKDRKIVNTINEDLKLIESDDESDDESDE